MLGAKTLERSATAIGSISGWEKRDGSCPPRILQQIEQGACAGIGAFLKRARQKSGQTQLEVAQAMGVMVQRDERLRLAQQPFKRWADERWLVFVGPPACKLYPHGYTDHETTAISWGLTQAFARVSQGIVSSTPLE